LCPAGYFDYVERTFQNEATVSASIVGYESPLVTWTINGHAVPVGFGTIDVDVTWDLPPRSKATSVPFRKPTATLTTWTLSLSSTQLVIRVGPNDGNATLTVECTVVESFDNVNLAGAGSTVRSDSLVVDLTNQKIECGQEYKDAAKHCSDLKHQAADPVPLPEPKPGDPPDLAQLLVRLLTEKGSNARERLDQAADLVRNRSTELSDTLTLYASRARER